MKKHLTLVALVAALSGCATLTPKGNVADCSFFDAAKQESLNLEKHANRLYSAIAEDLKKAFETNEVLAIPLPLFGSIYTGSSGSNVQKSVDVSNGVYFITPSLMVRFQEVGSFLYSFRITFPAGTIGVYARYRNDVGLFPENGNLEINEKCPPIGEHYATRGAYIKKEGDTEYRLINRFDSYALVFSPQLKSLLKSIINRSLPHLDKKVDKDYGEEFIERVMSFENRHPLIRETH